MKGHIFIAEDDLDMSNLLQNVFQRRGFRTTAISDGRDAFTKMFELKPDVLLLDLMLPNLHGFEICRLSKSVPELRPIPVVMLTALASSEDKLKGFKVGADDYVTKPFSTNDLVARIDRVLSGSQNRKIRILCAWCGMTLREGSDVGETSHGICPACSKQQLAAAAVMRRTLM